MKKRKHRFLIGYTGEMNVVYGREQEPNLAFAFPMTAFTAKQQLKKMPESGAVIYEIREVKLK